VAGKQDRTLTRQSRVRVFDASGRRASLATGSRSSNRVCGTGLPSGASRREAKWSRPRAAKRLLAGVIYCGDCGRKCYYTPRGGGLPG
jgi:hypothetical protein